MPPSFFFYLIGILLMAPPAFANITKGLKLIEEIDTGDIAPVYESSPGASTSEKILGRPARILPPGDTAKAIAYIIGKGKGLRAGKSYVLEIEYPDDVSRAFFVANRGGDLVRGWATGNATGDVREQFAEPSLESLNYPQTGQWQSFRQFFTLHERFQGIKARRNPIPGYRPFTPEDGFYIVLFQSKQWNDPRSEGIAVGKIRLYEVEDPSLLHAAIQLPPPHLPQRRVFWREEMADEAIESNQPEDRAVEDPLDWFRNKLLMARILGINTFCKDLLEFGFNQGWETGDTNWVMESQPPNTDLWTRLVPLVAAEGFAILPYYEFKGGIGLSPDSLAKQHRAEKLYHGIRGETYTPISWTQGHNADLTDPATIEDALRTLDQTIVRFKDEGDFVGAWFRTRDNHLPMSFAPATIARFKEDLTHNDLAQTANQQTLIDSYESDRCLYDLYADWWFRKRADFLEKLRDHLRDTLNKDDIQILFTPWISEAVPLLHAPDQPGVHSGILTDDPAWWDAFAVSMQDPWWRWHLNPSIFSQAVEENWFGKALHARRPINETAEEFFHSAPHADPQTYQNRAGIFMTFPIGRLFAVSNPETILPFRTPSGLSVIRHYPLNEQSDDPEMTPSPFDHLVGYLCVDVDRAGHHMLLDQARAIAWADPRNIGHLAGSAFSTGFPEIMSRFHQAFLAVPALPSERLETASDDPEVVVRRIPTEADGTYYFVVNTSMENKSAASIHFPEKTAGRNLVAGETLKKSTLQMDLPSAGLEAFHFP